MIQQHNIRISKILSHSEEDLKITAECNFFGASGASRGKWLCNGIGGTTKRLAARASLQRPFKNQILTLEDLFNFCNENIDGIKFFLIDKEEVEKEKAFQEERFLQAQTLAGTREKPPFIAHLYDDNSSQ